MGSRTSASVLLAISIILNLVLLVFWIASVAFGDARWGTWGQWAGAIASFLVAGVALGVALASRRSDQQREQAALDQAAIDSHRERWAMAADLGTDLWVAIDTRLAGQLDIEGRMDSLLRRINTVMRISAAHKDDDLDTYLWFLCSRAFQPLAFVLDESETPIPETADLLDERQLLLNDMTIDAEANRLIRTDGQLHPSINITEAHGLNDDLIDDNYPTALPEYEDEHDDGTQSSATALSLYSKFNSIVQSMRQVFTRQ